MVRHDTFTISRHLDASPDEVFTAFADTTVRRRWFRLPGHAASYEHDFRVGGGETARSTYTGLDTAPERLEYRSRYIDIARIHRIVYGYEAIVDDELRWTSLVTSNSTPRRTEPACTGPNRRPLSCTRGTVVRTWRTCAAQACCD